MRLTRRDWTFIAICLAVAVASLLVITRWFGVAFPEASIDFEYDRAESRTAGAALLREIGLDTGGMKHAVTFESDDLARIYLERTLGLERANRVMADEALVWYWRHRWFRPLQEEEYAVEIAPTGELVSYARTIPEQAPMPDVEEARAQAGAEAFLRRAGIDAASLDLVARSERRLPARVQRIFTWESKTFRPGGAAYRYVATVDGGAVSSFARRLRVPEEWIRGYRELRSKNEAAGRVDLIFLLITMLAALAVFIGRLRRGDMQLRFLLTIGAVTAVLVAGVTVNSFPSALASYDTTTSYPAFLAQLLLITAIQSVGSAMLLIVICGAGEVLYRERLPRHLAIPRLWTVRALASKRVFQSLILGYTLVGLFIAYQVAFYVAAAELGAWAPADIPYSDILNTAFPWIAVLFAGFFPAFSEEFLSRAFSIPFFERVLRSRIFAIVLAGFIWGFGHATYPQQPFYIRGLEVGLAGVLLGFLMYRYGLLSLLIWHYTVDAVYTSLLLFRSGNAYYIATAATATLVFAFPLAASIVLYIRNRGFLPDDDLTNAALPAPAAVAPPEEPADAPMPPPLRPSRKRIGAAVIAVCAATALVVFRPATPQDVVNYRIDGEEAKAAARSHLRSLGEPLPPRVAAIPVSGFRSWDDNSPREEGGAPGGFDTIAATYMVREGMPIVRLNEIMREEIPAATWMVRLFTPEEKTEYFVEVDARDGRVAGYHKYADESAPGDHLEREAALLLARRAFRRYGADSSGLELREALSFQQPNRRDWLFHFEQQPPLIGKATRRTTVRVMGSQISQFINTIHIPESVYREASQQTLVSIVLLVLKLAGIVVGLALVVAGAILATRHGGAAWRRAARITALLAIIPIVTGAVRGDRLLFTYSTTTAWETFTLNVVTDIIRTAGLQILVVFLAVAGILSVHPYAVRLFRAEGRPRFGRAAAVAALTAIALFVIFDEAMRWAQRAVPAIMRIDELSIPASIGLQLPSLLETFEAVIAAIVLPAAAALYVVVVARWRRQWLASVVTGLIIFSVSLDTNASLRELPFALGAAAALAAVVWITARFILGSNLLAWPATVFVASLLQGAGALLQNDRGDLLLHGAILLALATATLIWLAARPAPPPSPPDARSDTRAPLEPSSA
ncbi:MAG TPA: CPBP family glutamic-type intramembrane protease [Thermoanaerobaculia bacterium]|nr:CPBP family glutamic-type intramembrane protease [Thermoanaerobaculia bacterium]